MSYRSTAASALFGVTVGASIGSTIGSAIGRAYRTSQDEKERKNLIAQLKSQIALNYPPELTDRLLSEFQQSGEDLNFDFTKEIERYAEHKLYRFLLYRFGESFADALFVRKKKFENFEIEEPLSNLFERTLRQFSVENITGETVEKEFQEQNANDQQRHIETRKSEINNKIDKQFLDSILYYRSSAALIAILPDGEVIVRQDGRFLVYSDAATYRSEAKDSETWDALTSATDRPRAHELFRAKIGEVRSARK